MGGVISSHQSHSDTQKSSVSEGNSHSHQRGICTKLQITSSQGLVVILHQSVLNQKLREFVQTKWIPSHDTDDVQFKAEGRLLALNFIDFLSEARDYIDIPKCGFQYYRACSIFERYIMHGASNQIPLSTRVVDDCSQALFGGNENHDSKLFEAATTEATDFLMAEVFPSFEKLPLENFERKQSVDIANVMREKAKAIMRPIKGRQVMSKILFDSTYFTAFKNFCVRCEPRSRELINLYCDLSEIERTISSLDFNDIELNMVYFLHAVHGLYISYIFNDIRTMGLADATKGDFLQRISKCRTPDFEVLRPIEENLLTVLRQDFLELFLQSQEHTIMIQSGRDSVHKMVHEFPQGNSGASGVSHISSDASPVIEFNLPSVHHNLEDEVLHLLRSTPIYSLLTLGRSQYDVIFGQYLELVASEKVLMHFYQSCCRYKETIFANEMDRIASCTSIFERYLSGNSRTRIELPIECYREIVKNMFKPNQNIFDGASKWIMDHFCLNRYPQFKNEILYQAGEIDDDGNPTALTEKKRLGYRSIHTIIRCLVNMKPEPQHLQAALESFEKKSEDGSDDSGINDETSSEDVVLAESDQETSFLIRRTQPLTLKPFSNDRRRNVRPPSVSRMDGKKYTDSVK